MLVLLLSFLIVLVDQVTKYRVWLTFYPGESVVLIPGYFNLTYVRNPGAAWGMLGSLNGWLALFSVVILVSLCVFRRSFLTDILIHRLALSAMIGGIVGNLLDRLRLRYVVDFLDFHWGPHHFPAFNVADSAICIGVALYALSSFLISSHTKAEDPAGGRAEDGNRADSGLE